MHCSSNKGPPWNCFSSVLIYLVITAEAGGGNHSLHSPLPKEKSQTQKDFTGSSFPSLFYNLVPNMEFCMKMF